MNWHTGIILAYTIIWDACTLGRQKNTGKKCWSHERITDQVSAVERFFNFISMPLLDINVITTQSIVLVYAHTKTGPKTEPK